MVSVGAHREPGNDKASAIPKGSLRGGRLGLEQIGTKLDAQAAEGRGLSLTFTPRVRPEPVNCPAG